MQTDLVRDTGVSASAKDPANRPTSHRHPARPPDPNLSPWQDARAERLEFSASPLPLDWSRGNRHESAAAWLQLAPPKRRHLGRR